MRNNLFTPLIHRMAVLSTALILLVAGSPGCSNDDAEEGGILSISEVVLPEQIDTAIGSEVSLSGKGFKSGDVILLRSALVSSTEYTAQVLRVTS